MRKFCCAVGAVALTATAIAQPTVDGTLDPFYCSALALQQNQTGFGDANAGQPGTTNGSELDGAYAQIDGGTLYLFLSGNVESNFNKLEVFFDTVSGGQNQLLGGVTNGDGNINRMGTNPGNPGGQPGLKFDAGFEADYWLSLTGGGGPYAIYIDYADIPTAAGGTKLYLGTTGAASDGTLTGGDPNSLNIRVTINNSNTGGVTGGNGVDLGGLAGSVTTGVEIAIPLAAIGNPTSDFKVSAFINGQGHDFLANQFLGSILGGSTNVGEPRTADLTAKAGDQFFTVPIMTTPCSACCIGTSCSIQTAADCATNGGTSQPGVGCAPNPCVVAPTGSCCVGNSCSVQNEADCATLFGEYLGDGTNCTANPCFTGACCIGTSCQVVREAVCTSQTGTYLGNGTSCNGDPCATGACCVGTSCSEVRLAVCGQQNGTYFGNFTTCTQDQCTPGACCLGTTCVQALALVCTNQGGTNFGSGVSCTPARCSTPADAIEVDGSLDAEYCDAQVVQNTQTNFGDATQGTVDFAGGSELDAAYAAIQGGRLHLLFTGNLESNFNKLEIFFDTRAGGQNRLNGQNPNVDFNALNRMGDEGSGNGLTFDTAFEADFWIDLTGGGTPYRTFVNYAELSDPADPVTNPGIGFYLGSGKAADITAGGLLDSDVNATNPFGILATVNNSNIAGIGGGQALLDSAGIAAAEAVTTGVELSIPLSAIGNPATLADIKISAFVNGSGHDFLSNQVLGGIGGGDNLAEPRNVNFSSLAGDQYFTLADTCAGGCVVGDANCDGTVNNFDIDAFVDIILFNTEANAPAGWLARGLTQACWDQRGCTANIDRSPSGVNNFDIDPFVACILSLPPDGESCP